MVAEYIAYQVFSPWAAVTVDSSGFHSEYLMREVLRGEHRRIDASDLNSSSLLKKLLDTSEPERALVITGTHPLREQNHGKCHPLQSLESDSSIH